MGKNADAAYFQLEQFKQAAKQAEADHEKDKAAQSAKIEKLKADHEKDKDAQSEKLKDMKADHDKNVSEAKADNKRKAAEMAKKAEEEVSSLKQKLDSKQSSSNQAPSGPGNEELPKGLASFPERHIQSYMQAAPFPPPVRDTAVPLHSGSKRGAVVNDRHIKICNLGSGLERPET